jgi:hypothetical protein
MPGRKAWQESLTQLGNSFFNVLAYSNFIILDEGLL